LDIKYFLIIWNIPDRSKRWNSKKFVKFQIELNFASVHLRNLLSSPLSHIFGNGSTETFSVVQPRPLLLEMSVRYTVVATLKDLSVQDEYLSWLRESHVKDVIRTGGALSAEVIIRGNNQSHQLYCPDIRQLCRQRWVESH
jgi:hypothetical protein